MKWFRISKWEKYQHYHKPRPRWIKLYTSINDHGTDWRDLSDAEIGQVVRLMAYAALNENALPFHEELLREMVGFDTKLGLDKLKKLGVITVFKDKASCLSIKNSRAKSSENSIVPRSEVRGQSSEGRGQRSEKKKQESGKPSVLVLSPPVCNVANQVLLHLNNLTGKKFSRTGDIAACIKREKCTAGECVEVLEYKWFQWAGTEMQKNVNPTTPFRAKHFQAYLDEARAGAGKTVAPKAVKQFGKYGVADANMEAMRQVNKELGYESENNGGIDWSCISSERADDARKDQALLTGPGGDGREPSPGRNEGSGEGVQVFPEASGDQGHSTEAEERRNGNEGTA